MKCIVLAGGNGGSLWPISRKEFPQQFVEIREGRSVFQENIAKNMPYCDEFYIFTNDSEWAKMHFKENDMEVVECNNRNNSYLDMFLMSSCKANIIANSTFSWWGAWLNSGQEKLVIAPKKWFNNHEINDIVCESWIKIDSQGEI